MWPQAVGKELFNNVTPPNDRSSLGKGRNIGIGRTTFKCDLHRMVQWSHGTTQRVGSLATDISCLLHRHPTIEPVAITPAYPLVPHSMGKPRPTPEATRVKSDATKLSDMGALRPFKLNLLILVVQLIVLSKDICCRTAPQEVTTQINLLIWMIAFGVS
jgi:hypothetical protein